MIGPLGSLAGVKPEPLTVEQQDLREAAQRQDLREAAQRQDLREAAQGFEAIMLRKILETARETPFTQDAPLTGGGMKQFKTMRDEHFAEIASRSGGLGFARSIEEQLAQFVSPKRAE